MSASASASILRIGAFAPEAPFLPSLAKLWLAGGGTAEGLIILPSRRAAQALAAAFLQANAGAALLLPRIIALGNMDEAGLSLPAGFALPPAISAAKRQALLTKLILAMNGAGGTPQKPHAAWILAGELAALLDEADYAELDLAAVLPDLVEGELAAHWQKTLTFLRIITHAWPQYLRAQGLLNPAARLKMLIREQARQWRDKPPKHRVWMVAAEGNPAIARMARVVARLTEGMLVLPGYDPALDATAWAALDLSHPQAGIARLLTEIGARREEIVPLPADVPEALAGRGALFSRALLPAAALAAWQEPAELSTQGVFMLTTPDEAQNALAIAMILRDALEVPGTNAALITPDRALAARVAALLKRFGINADDSAGEALTATPPAVLLRLLARAAHSDYAPLPLLSLLKHPLAAGGLPPAQFRDQARKLELRALRGPRPGPGFAGIKFRLAGAPQSLIDFTDRLELLLRPLMLPVQIAPHAALRLLVEAAEALAATDTLPGAAVLWAGEAGAALSDLLADMFIVLDELPDMASADLPDLLDALLADAVVRKPRSKDGHPRIAIWGIQEAALQTVDVAVLGGLVEGVWPAASEPGPWLSRPMRAAAGLPSLELKISQMAHALFAACCTSAEVVLAAPSRRERAPAVPARWLTRLETMLQGADMALPAHKAASWASQLDMPHLRDIRPPPYPRPPAPRRPRRLSISEMALLITDPYAIYARKILNLRPLDGLDAESDQSLFGEIVHEGVAKFFAEGGFGEALDGRAPPGAVARLTTMLETAMQARRPRASLAHWWAARLSRIAAWVVDYEQNRRADRGVPQILLHEQTGEMAFTGGFTLTGRADRIERAADGTVSILDYKTGTVPGEAEVAAGTAPQLPLEAMMAQAGVFGAAFVAPVTELSYIKLSGRAQPGKDTSLFTGKPETLSGVIKQAETAAQDLFDKFAEASTPYLVSPHAQRENRFDDYAGISRRAEWEGETDANSD